MSNEVLTVGSTRTRSLSDFCGHSKLTENVQVDAFYKAALAAGGKDNGAPGLRPDYHANYYGAFVIDPEGNNIEAVCHLPE